MDLEDCLNYLNNTGYCLWVGAGIGKYLSINSDIKIPNWDELVDELEKVSNITRPDYSVSLVERLEVVFMHSSSFSFKNRIRELILKKVASAIINIAGKNIGSVPNEILRISKLGMLANPIVNFNVESLTSLMLQIGGGHYTIKSYGRKEYGDNIIMTKGSNFHKVGDKFVGQRFKRHIYHPHGEISSYSVSVFTEADYRKHTNSLAYQLAVHGAFSDNLVIVGMSLNDIYLKEQISIFKGEINQIYLFQQESEINQELKHWCWINNVKIISFENWSIFWEKIDSIMPEPSEKDLLLGWHQIIIEAIYHLNDAFNTESSIKQFKMFEDSEELVLNLKRDFISQGIRFKESLDSEKIVTHNEQFRLTNELMKKIIKLSQS